MVDPAGTDCKRIRGANCKILMEECIRPTGWYYNRFTKRIEGQELAAENGEMVQKCLHRHFVNEKPSLIGADCDDSEHQTWERKCDTFAYMNDAGKDDERWLVITA